MAAIPIVGELIAEGLIAEGIIAGAEDAGAIAVEGSEVPLLSDAAMPYEGPISSNPTGITYNYRAGTVEDWARGRYQSVPTFDVEGTSEGIAVEGLPEYARPPSFNDPNSLYGRTARQIENGGGGLQEFQNLIPSMDEVMSGYNDVRDYAARGAAAYEYFRGSNGDHEMDDSVIPAAPKRRFVEPDDDDEVGRPSQRPRFHEMMGYRDPRFDLDLPRMTRSERSALFPRAAPVHLNRLFRSRRPPPSSNKSCRTVSGKRICKKKKKKSKKSKSTLSFGSSVSSLHNPSIIKYPRKKSTRISASFPSSWTNMPPPVGEAGRQFHHAALGYQPKIYRPAPSSTRGKVRQYKTTDHDRAFFDLN